MECVIIFFCFVTQVQQVTRVAQRHCQCPSTKCNKLKVKKVGEGRYNIAGRNVFIRVRFIVLLHLILFFILYGFNIKK